MRQHDFERLQVGDLCTIIRGNDAGMIVEVVHIETFGDVNAIVIKPAGNKQFKGMYGSVYSRHLKVSTACELRLYSYKD